MASTTISASPDVLFIDTGSGETSGTAEIAYDSPDPVVMWQRVNLGFWKRLNLFKLVEVGTKDADHRGKFVSDPLAPGDFMQYRIYTDAAIDPNLVPDNQYAYIEARIAALLLKPDPSDWIRDGNADVGGTFFFRQIATPPILTTIRAEISQDPPFTDKFGQLQFKNVVASALSVLSTNHLLELKPLLPGTPHFCAFRLSDAKGRWFYLEEKPVTLKRRVSVWIDSLYVDNDGDPLGRGEASFNITTYEGDKEIDQIAFGNDAYEVTDGQTVPLNHLIVLGPKQITPANHAVGINAAGTEYDGWLESDEHADTWGYPPDLRRQLDFPAGRFVEQVNDQAFTVPAVPGSVNDDFQFTVNGRYSVDYS